MILRDHLATDRTVLANERTVLAYIRTALSLIVSGASFIKFSETPLVQVIGYFFIPLGAYIGIKGLKNYMNVSKRLAHLQVFNSDEPYEPENDPEE
jgi:putative membrane protein